MTEQTKEVNKDRHKGGGVIIPLVLVFVFMTVMVVYVSSLMYRVAVSNSNAVMEDRILTVSGMINTHLNTAENVLHVAGDSVHHMLISGTTTARIHEFLVDETRNVSEQFDENYTGIYGYIMGKYIDGLNWEPPEGYDPKSRDWFIVAKEADGQVALSDSYIDAQTGNLIISACRMLPDRQSVIALDVQLQGIQSMMKELTLNGKGYGFVVDGNGLIIAHRDEEKKGTSILDTAGGAEYLNVIKNAGSGSFSYAVGGVPSTVFVNSIVNDWYVVLEVTDRELYTEVRSQLAVTIFLSTVIFIMIAALYYKGHKNELKYAKDMEEMKLEEQKATYERKVLELEKDAANASNKAKSDFLANMSHEIRTPMNAIIGMDEMILRTSPDSQVRKFALDIQSAGKTLLSIINDILDLSKIESGKMELVPVEYSFASVMNDVVNMTMKKAQDKGLEYNINVAEDVPSKLLGDEIRVRQIMLNIINNAIKYTHEGSVSVDMTFDKFNQMLKMVVADTGIGIKDEDIGRLFDAFQRLEEDKNRDIEGTGLGLNITMRLVKMMDGAIDVSSKYGEGTTFTVQISQPAISDVPVGDFSKNLMRIREDTAQYRPALIAPDARILVVDDNDMNLEVINGLLEDTKMKVTTAESGKECLEILEKGTFDVVFLDQMMPGMSGVQTLKEIKDRHLAGGTPIIALTADAIVGAKDNYIKEGFTDYLSKPVMYDALEAILLKYLRAELIRDEADKETPDGKAASTDKTDDARLVTVVDDDPDFLVSIKEMLKEEDIKLNCLRSGNALLKFVEKHTPDLILLDILMPETDGFDTFEKLRQFEDKEGREHIPVIFLTGGDDYEKERAELTPGASGYMSKPVKKETLLERIEDITADN